jgi:hypothetical protein
VAFFGDIMTEKQCTKCLKIKSIDDFYLRSTDNIRASACKACFIESITMRQEILKDGKGVVKKKPLREQKENEVNFNYLARQFLTQPLIRI